MFNNLNDLFICFVFGKLQQYGVQDDQIPFIILLSEKTKYLKSNVEPDEISPWLKKYKVISFPKFKCFVFEPQF